MHQEASGPNSAQIGGDVVNSKVKIKQEYHVADNIQRFVKLEVEPSTIKRYSKSDIGQRALRGSIVVAIPFVVTFIGLFADWLEILAPLELGTPRTIFISIMLGIMLATVAFIIEQKNVTGLYYWFKSLSMNREEGKLIGPGKFLEVDRDGDYLTYYLSGDCIYPACNGKVVAVKAPPREGHRAQLAGICTVAGEAHSYLIDYNGVAVPRELDWRPPDPPGYSSGQSGYRY